MHNYTNDLQTEHVQTIYQCTWPGCQVRKELCDDIEAHVREQHLRRAAPANREEDDHEEEFYYTEIDIPLQIYQPPNKAVCKKLDVPSELLDSVDVFIFDCDGVIWKGRLAC